MKKIATAIMTVAVLFFANVSSVLAQANPYGPYNPYQPHNPVPTGLEDTTIFYIAAGTTFVLGMSVLAIAKILKAKQSLA